LIAVQGGESTEIERKSCKLALYAMEGLAHILGEEGLSY